MARSKDDPGKQFFPITPEANRHGVSADTIRRYIDTGIAEGFRIGGRRFLTQKGREDVERYRKRLAARLADK